LVLNFTKDLTPEGYIFPENMPKPQFGYCTNPNTDTPLLSPENVPVPNQLNFQYKRKEKKKNYPVKTSKFKSVSVLELNT
jgi:hypothetical protein